MAAGSDLPTMVSEEAARDRERGSGGSADEEGEGELIPHQDRIFMGRNSRKLQDFCGGVTGSE